LEGQVNEEQAFNARIAEEINRYGKELKGVPLDYEVAIARFVCMVIALHKGFGLDSDQFAALFQLAMTLESSSGVIKLDKPQGQPC
jgi:hypothetical protein